MAVCVHFNTVMILKVYEVDLQLVQLDFMHMHYPEVDIPLDVMEVAIFESRDIPQSDKPMPGYHDYLKGNTLIVLGSSMPVACLPCGEVGHQLRCVLHS